MKKQTTAKVNVAEVITNRILEIIETTGTLPWSRPWMQTKSNNGNAPRNFVTGRAYQGINAMLLFAVAQSTGYSSNHWLTFKQAAEKRGTVRRGEKGCPVVYYSMIEIKDEETGDLKKIPFMKYSTVFNLDQVEGITAPAIFAAPEPEATFDPIEAAEAIIANMPNRPEIHHGGNKACYSPVLDYIKMPPREQFTHPAHYYQTLLHELSHSTGHASRVGRKGIMEPTYFASHEYSKEEMISEIAACSLSHTAGIYDQIEKNSAAYVKSWAAAIKADKTMIIHAAAAAQKAFDYILNIKPEAGSEAPEQTNAEAVELAQAA